MSIGLSWTDAKKERRGVHALRCMKRLYEVIGAFAPARTESGLSTSSLSSQRP
jgi:hypothetical protein